MLTFFNFVIVHPLSSSTMSSQETLSTTATAETTAEQVAPQTTQATQEPLKDCLYVLYVYMADSRSCRVTGFAVMSGMGSYAIYEALRMGAFSKHLKSSGAQGGASNSELRSAVGQSLTKAPKPTPGASVIAVIGVCESIYENCLTAGMIGLGVGRLFGFRDPRQPRVPL